MFWPQCRNELSLYLALEFEFKRLTPKANYSHMVTDITFLQLKSTIFQRVYCILPLLKKKTHFFLGREAFFERHPNSLILVRLQNLVIHVFTLQRQAWFEFFKFA